MASLEESAARKKAVRLLRALNSYGLVTQERSDKFLEKTDMDQEVVATERLRNLIRDTIVPEARKILPEGVKIARDDDLILLVRGLVTVWGQIEKVLNDGPETTGTQRQKRNWKRQTLDSDGARLCYAILVKPISLEAAIEGLAIDRSDRTRTTKRAPTVLRALYAYGFVTQKGHNFLETNAKDQQITGTAKLKMVFKTAIAPEVQELLELLSEGVEDEQA